MPSTPKSSRSSSTWSQISQLRTDPPRSTSPSSKVIGRAAGPSASASAGSSPRRNGANQAPTLALSVSAFHTSSTPSARGISMTRSKSCSFLHPGVSQGGDLLVAQLHLDTGEQLGQLFGHPRRGDGRGNEVVAELPGDGRGRHRRVVGGGDVVEDFEGTEGLLVVDIVGHSLPTNTAGGVSPGVFAGEEPGGQRVEGQFGHAFRAQV